MPPRLGTRRDGDLPGYTLMSVDGVAADQNLAVGGRPIIPKSRPDQRVADDAGAPASAAAATNGVEPLTPSNAGRVRLPLSSRFGPQSLADHVRRLPGMSFIASGGREYAVVGPWRHRTDIAELIELSSGPSEESLVDRLAQSLAARDVRLVVLDYSLAARDPAFFGRNGFSLVERIVEYERPDRPVNRQSLPDGFSVRPYRPEDREALLAVEHKSFPWLWWNSAEEWGNYIWTRGVEVLVGIDRGEVVGYAGYVIYRRDGHLDRLAVRQSEQGRGLGAALLTESLARMVSRGVNRVALTTQEDNYRSQKLYEQNGFRRARWAYEIHGRWLGQSEESES